MVGPIRVLHVVVNMNRGGAEMLIMNIYRNVDRSKIQFDFLTFKEGVFDSEIRALGGQVYRIPYVTDVGHFGFIKVLDQFFATHNQYKILHSHMDKMSGLIIRSAKSAGIAVRIAHSHSTKNEGGLAACLYKWYAGRSILRDATHYVACSKSAARWLFAKKMDKVVVVKNGIESNKFVFCSELRASVREELKLEHGSSVLGHVGRFCHPKNHQFLLKIFAEFNRVHPTSILVLVGDGPLRSEMERKVQELNLGSSVRFLGVRDDINRILQAFDVFVFPSMYEGMPVTLIEAQGSGLPCIISDVITPEVDMGIQLIDYTPLLDPMVWVDKIKRTVMRKVPRALTANHISEQGYDITSTAAWADGFYSSVLRVNRS